MMLMKRLREIHIVIHVDREFQVIPAYQSDDGRVYLVKVCPTNMGSLYTADSGHIALGESSKDAEGLVVELLLHKSHLISETPRYLSVIQTSYSRHYDEDARLSV